MRMWKRPAQAALLVLIAASNHAKAAPVLYGSDVVGRLFTINLSTGAGTLVGALSSPTTEIEFDNINYRAYSQLPDGAFLIRRFDITNGSAIGPLIPDGGSFTGLEFAGSTLYGTVITGPQFSSTLRTLNPATGVSTIIGSTGVGPISGLAYNELTSTLYGIAGGPGPAGLYSINLTTGLASLIGSTGIQAGSLEFGPDGTLYAGGTGPNSGQLYRVNLISGATTLVGPTGFSGITGLTLVNIPEPGTIWLLSLGLSTLNVCHRLSGKRQRRGLSRNTGRNRACLRGC